MKSLDASKVHKLFDLIISEIFSVAQKVSALAQKYFSHLPEVASPLNYLYVGCYAVPEDEKDDPEDEEAQWDNIYFDPIGAFMTIRMP